MAPDPDPASTGTLRPVATAVRRRRRGAVELVELRLERIAEHRDLGAVVAVDAAGALAQARTVSFTLPDAQRGVTARTHSRQAPTMSTYTQILVSVLFVLPPRSRCWARPAARRLT